MVITGSAASPAGLHTIAHSERDQHQYDRQPGVLWRVVSPCRHYHYHPRHRFPHHYRRYLHRHPTRCSPRIHCCQNHCCRSRNSHRHRHHRPSQYPRPSLRSATTTGSTPEFDQHPDCSAAPRSCGGVVRRRHHGGVVRLSIHRYGASHGAVPHVRRPRARHAAGGLCDCAPVPPQLRGAHVRAYRSATRIRCSRSRAAMTSSRS